MKTPLLPTQEVDVEQIAAATDLPNFSEAGTGKTLTTIGAIERMKLNSGLVVCPPSAPLMWQRLLTDELGAYVQWLKTGATVIDRRADFYVVTYALLKDHFSELMEGSHEALVCDESQNAKSSDAQRTAALFGESGDGAEGLYATSKQCWMLSGTPMERYADDLWSQLRATQPEVLQRYGALSLAEFQRQFCRMEWKEYASGAVRKYVSTANQNEKLLNRMLYNQQDGIGAIRRTQADVDPYMPEVTFRIVFTPAKVSGELRSLLMGKSEQQIMDMILAGGSEIAKARRLMGMAKVDKVVAYIKEAKQKNEPMLVGFWHEDVGQALKERFEKQFRVALISGATSATKREQIKLAAMDGDFDFLFGQIHAMGTAMDGLQTAMRHVTFAELDWSWSKMEQFYKRVARKGQLHKTQVDFCSAQEAVDLALWAIAQSKKKGMEDIVG